MCACFSGSTVVIGQLKCEECQEDSKKRRERRMIKYPRKINYVKIPEVREKEHEEKCRSLVHCSVREI